MSLRVLIVDDEPVARQRLRRLLRKVGDVTIVAECPDGDSASAAIREHDLDLVFLDVQMPKLSGFDVVRAVGSEKMPAVVFVTAFDRFALQAFEAQAVDYLLKPFGEDRVRKALKRVRTFLDGGARRDLQEQLTGLLRATAGSQQTSCMLVKDGVERLRVLQPREIDWIEAEGDYVRLHLGPESLLHRITLAEMEQRLKPEGFVRIHRSRLVNLSRVKEFRALLRGESVVVLKNGAQLNASQSCFKQLQEQLDAAG